MRLLLLLLFTGSSWAGVLRDKRQSGGTITFFNQSFPGPPGVPQGTIDQFQGAFQQGMGFFPQPPPGFIPQPPQGFIPQPPQGFFPQPPQGFFPSFPGQGGNTGGTEQQPQSDSFVGRKDPQPIIPIVSYEFSPSSADGSYKFSYESGDGTKREESGSQKAVGEPPESGTVAQGSYSYTDPDGNLVQVSYTADERGFIATGSHIPTPPPVPHEILRALETSAANEAAQNNGVIPPAYHHVFKNAYHRHY